MLGGSVRRKWLQNADFEHRDGYGHCVCYDDYDDCEQRLLRAKEKEHRPYSCLFEDYSTTRDGAWDRHHADYHTAMESLVTGQEVVEVELGYGDRMDPYRG